MRGCAFLDRFKIVGTQGRIEMPYDKPTERGVFTSQLNEARQSIPMIRQDSSYGLAIALSNRPIIAVSKFLK